MIVKIMAATPRLNSSCQKGRWSNTYHVDRVTIILSRIMATTPRLNSSCQKDDGVIPILLDRVTIILSRIMATTPKTKLIMPKRMME